MHTAFNACLAACYERVNVIDEFDSLGNSSHQESFMSELQSYKVALDE